MTDELAQHAEARLLVDAAAMAVACNAFRKFLKTKKNLGDALLAFHDGKLRVEIGGMAQSVPAKGNWRGDARLSSQFILGLVGLPPTGEVVFTVADGKLLVQVRRNDHHSPLRLGDFTQARRAAANEGGAT